MMRLSLLALTAMTAMVMPAAAQVPGDDPRIAKGFEHFYSLEYDQAIVAFSAAVADKPTDPARYNHLAQSILYRAMFHAGALESELVTGNNPFLRRDKVNPSAEDQQRFDTAIRKAIELGEARVAGNSRDIEAMYAAGVAYALRANYNFLVRKAWMDSLRDATRARKLHNRITEIDPSFADARLVQGVHDYVVGSLPFTYKMLGFLVGYRGDKDEGIRTLKLVAEKGKRVNLDAQILLGVILRREKRPAEAIPMVEGLRKRFPRNYLFLFELAQMHGDTGNKAGAFAALDQMEALKRSGTPGYQALPSEKIYYAKGNLQFWYNDLDAAVENLRRATAKANDLDLNTGVYAWMRLGQAYDLKGRRGDAQAAYRAAIAYAPQSEAARESQRYLSSPYRREKRG